MNLNLKNKLQKKTLLSAGLIVLCIGCDSSSSDETQDSGCTVTLTRTDAPSQILTNTEIVFTGEFSQSFVEQTTQKSGTTRVKVSTKSSEADESVALKELKAGNRKIEFDPESDNLKRGSFESSFTSSLLPDWSVPWQDRPETITLSMNASPATNPNSIPATVIVELSF